MNSGGQTIKFMRPQQNIQKVNTSIPPLTRVTQASTGTVQVKVLLMFFFYLMLTYACL